MEIYITKAFITDTTLKNLFIKRSNTKNKTDHKIGADLI